MVWKEVVASGDSGQRKWVQRSGAGGVVQGQDASRCVRGSSLARLFDVDLFCPFTPLLCMLLFGVEAFSDRKFLSNLAFVFFFSWLLSYAL